MNRSLLEVDGALGVVSQFTLYGDARHGRRPSFAEAAAPAEDLKELGEHFVEYVWGSGPLPAIREPMTRSASPSTTARVEGYSTFSGHLPAAAVAAVQSR